MKLTEKNKIIIEWTAAVVLIILCINYYILSYKSFTPLQVFKNAERTSNYGPSTIVEKLERDGNIIYLARYKDWISTQVIKRDFIMWSSADGGVTGAPIDYNKKITYYYSGSTPKDSSKFLWNLYGYVNDKNITQVDVQIKRKDKIENLQCKVDNSKMFIFSWLDSKNERSIFIKIIGKDKNNNIIYEHEGQ